MKTSELDTYSHLIRSLAAHFGNTTEIALHDLKASDAEHSIVAIENGFISGRKTGDGPSHIVLEAIRKDPSKLNDRLAYLTKTKDGKILKSSTIYLRDDSGELTGILAINTDITMTLALEQTLHAFNSVDEPDQTPEPITTNVSDLLDTLISQSISLIGKPTALMNKEEKIRALRFLNDSGAFLITKSGPKVCQVYGISKYTLYSYLDEAKAQDDQS
jgi:predicted transcriptional regulator YheO